MIERVLLVEPDHSIRWPSLANVCHRESVGMCRLGVLDHSLAGATSRQGCQRVCVSGE
jgi:hypothetical protein